MIKIRQTSSKVRKTFFDEAHSSDETCSSLPGWWGLGGGDPLCSSREPWLLILREIQYWSRGIFSAYPRGVSHQVLQGLHRLGWDPWWFTDEIHVRLNPWFGANLSESGALAARSAVLIEGGIRWRVNGAVVGLLTMQQSACQHPGRQSLLTWDIPGRTGWWWSLRGHCKLACIRRNVTGSVLLWNLPLGMRILDIVTRSWSDFLCAVGMHVISIACYTTWWEIQQGKAPRM